MPTPGPTPPYDETDLNIESPLEHEYPDVPDTPDDVPVLQEEDTIHEETRRPKRSTAKTGVNYKDLHKGKVNKDPLIGQL